LKDSLFSTISKLRLLSVVIIIGCLYSKGIAQNPPLPEEVILFQKYLSIDTSNPPGDVSKAIEFLRQTLEREGIPVELVWTNKYLGRGNVIARLKSSGKKRPIVLLHHMDVVPVNLSSWRVNPFGGIVKDEYIYGRGALDMKNIGIAQLMTLIQLKRNNIPLERDVILLAVCDEETGSTMGASWIVINNWNDMKAEYLLDEGGFGTQGFFTNNNKLIVSVGIAEKRSSSVTLSVRGNSGYLLMLPKDNPSVILVQALAKIADYQMPEHITPAVAEMMKRLGTLDNTPYNNAIKRNTFSLVKLKDFVGDSSTTNVIPDRAEATLECSLLPGQDVNALIAELRKVINDPRVTLSAPRRQPFIKSETDSSVTSPFDTELFRIIEQETKKVYPESITIPSVVIYPTDSRLFRPKGAVCYGFFPGLITMDDYRTIHLNNERIRVESFTTAVKIYYNVVKELCREK